MWGDSSDQKCRCKQNMHKINMPTLVFSSKLSQDDPIFLSNEFMNLKRKTGMLRMKEMQHAHFKSIIYQIDLLGFGYVVCMTCDVVKDRMRCCWQLKPNLRKDWNNQKSQPVLCCWSFGFCILYSDLLPAYYYSWIKHRSTFWGNFINLGAMA